VELIKAIQEVTFSLWYYWGFKSSSLGLVVSDISKDCDAFIFKGQAIQEKLIFLGLLDPWRWGRYDPLKHWEPFTQWPSITPQKT